MSDCVKGLSDKTVRRLRAQGDPHLRGKTVLITGANSGVGFQTARIALFAGAKVILACRSDTRAARAANELRREFAGAQVSVMRLDLANLASIDAFADALNGTDIDVFVNNAGVFRHPGETTADGFDLVMGTNYIGVYYLSERILPYLASLPHPVTYVNTISLIHKFARVDPQNVLLVNETGDLAVYARSKLCLAKYTYALAERYRASNVRVAMIHPGIVITPLGINAFGKRVGRWAKALRGLFNSPETSALSLAYLMAHDVPAGAIVGPSKGFGGWGCPKQNRVCRKVQRGAEELIRVTDGTLRPKTNLCRKTA